MNDPNLHWDGTRWLRWDGTQWVADQQLAPVGQPPGNSFLWPAIAGLAVLAVLAAAVIVVVVIRRSDAPAATPTTSSVPQSSASPTEPTATSDPAAVRTAFFIKPQSDGTVYAVGAQIRGSQVSGWAGPLRTGDLTCFNGSVSNGVLSGTLASVGEEGAGGETGQPFSWPVSGEGASLKLTQVGTISGFNEVSVATVNDFAGLGPKESWQKTFTTCQQLVGGVG